MKLITTLLFATLCTSMTSLASASEPAKPLNPNYNAELATKLGGDERGMKSYVLVTLKTGPNDAKITDKEQRSKLFMGHFANMTRLADEGKLAVAGPFVAAKPKRGLLIFNVATLAEAEALIKTDPTVEAGVFIYEMSQFYGSAALMQVNDIHKTLSKH